MKWFCNAPPWKLHERKWENKDFVMNHSKLHVKKQVFCSNPPENFMSGDQKKDFAKIPESYM